MTADLQSLKSSKFSKYKETHYKMPVDSWGYTGNNPTWCEDGGKVNFMLKHVKMSRRNQDILGWIQIVLFCKVLFLCKLESVSPYFCPQQATFDLQKEH